MGLPVRDPDDGLALALALASPELHIAGCTTSAGNCRTEESTRCTLDLLRAAGCTNIPVAEGAHTPLIADRSAHHAMLDKKSKSQNRHYWEQPATRSSYETLCEATPRILSPCPTPAHTFIVDTVKSHPRDVTLVMLGGFTNLALALREAPEIAPLIKEVVHMGGAFTPVSSQERCFVWDTPDMPNDAWDTLRFNTWFDPEATVEVLTANIPVRFITANVTVHVFLRKQALARVVETHQKTLSNLPRNGYAARWANFFRQHTTPWLEWSIAERKLSGAHMHDPLTVACVFAPHLCRYTTMHADTQAFLCGEDWLKRTPTQNSRPVQVAVDVDVETFEALLEERLTFLPSG